MGKAHRHAILALAILLACCRFVFALNPSLDINQYAHTAWRTSEGFNKGSIYSIAQTPDGYLWLGTEVGLLRFDGVRSVPWQPSGGQRLPEGRIKRLLVTRDGTLWIGTDGGLGSLKNGQLTHYPELAGHIIFALLEDRDGTLWAGGTGVSNGILCGIHNGSVHCYGDDGSFGQGVFALHEDGKSNLWARVADGLWKWKPSPPKFYSLPGEPPSTQALSEDADGTLLVGWNGGIYRFVDGKTEAYSPPGISRQFMSRTLRDRNGGLWIGTHESGLLHVHQGRTDVFSTSDGLSGEVILGILEDREGNIWVGTNGGLDRFRDSAAVTSNVKQGLSNAVVVTALADKDGSVWLATIGGLNRWDHGQIMVPPTGTAKRDGKLNGNSPTSLFQDDRGRIWVSTFREFGYLENGRFTTVKGVPEGNKPSIAQDTAGNVWVIDSYVGLFQISPQNEVREIPWADLGHKDDASVLAAERRQGGLWIGFSQGGIGYFSDGQLRATYTTTDGLGAGRVRDLQFGDDGALWVSTEHGLSHLKNKRIATMTSKNGLPCDAVQWAMEEDDRSLWLYMACGLVRIARSELDAWVADPNRAIQATVFDSSDGVRSTLLIGVNHPQVARTPDGRLWFVTGDGVSVIDTHHLPHNDLPPPVHVEQIIADRKTYDASSDANGRLRLPPLIRDLEIDYTALSLVAPEKVRFRVKLEGWDRDWKDVGNERRAFYSNLPPRNYRFRVIACNNSGVWNEAGASLDFSIAPAYYQTNWFRALCVAVFLGVLWVLYQVRIQQMRRQERKLRDVIETIPTFAWTALPDGSLDFVNCHWQEYTGLSTEKTVGSGWETAAHPEDVKRYAEKWRAATASGEPFESEVRFRRATDAHYRLFLTRAVPLRDARGKILKWYGTSTDIEDREHAKQLQAELAHINRVTTMGELTASLAHELKQPIVASVIYANACTRWLKREKPDLEEALAATSRILENQNRAADMIERLRSLYKKSAPKRELVEMNEIVHEMAVLMRGEANRHEVSIRTDLAADLPRITADHVQLQQVLMNLMLNGIEAMNETGGVLAVKTQLDGDQLLISVSDTGVGLPAEKADQIFDAFVTTKTQGSGMGLAISRSIVDSHGGRLWAAANDGQGATFYFTLRASAEEVKVPAEVT